MTHFIRNENKKGKAYFHVNRNNRKNFEFASLHTLYVRNENKIIQYIYCNVISAFNVRVLSHLSFYTL